MSGILLPKRYQQAHQTNWPTCARCMRTVDAYGIDEETPRILWIWARCGGIRLDPDSGLAVFGSGMVHSLMHERIGIRKGPNWGPNAASLCISRMQFFAPSETAHSDMFVNEFTKEAIRPS